MAKREQISSRLPRFQVEWLRLGKDGLTAGLEDAVRMAMIYRDFDRYREIYAGDLDLVQVLNLTPGMIESENPDESTEMVSYILTQGAASRLAWVVESRVRTGAYNPKEDDAIRAWLLDNRAAFQPGDEDIHAYLTKEWRKHAA